MLQLRWSGGEHQVRLHHHFTAAAAAAAAEAQKLKKQAVCVYISDFDVNQH